MKTNTENTKPDNSNRKYDWTDSPLGSFVFTAIKYIVRTAGVIVGLFVAPTFVKLAVKTYLSFKDMRGVIVL